MVDHIFRDDDGRLFRVREFGKQTWLLHWRPLGQGGYWDAGHTLRPADVRPAIDALSKYHYLLPAEEMQAYAGGLPIEGRVIHANPKARRRST
jgi:hypothetical protein